MFGVTAASSRGKWYGAGLRFACRQCGACCGGEPGYVWVTRYDIALLALASDVTPETFRRTYTRRVDRRTSLQERPNGDCILLNEGRCSAYEARPLQCRTWPFWRDNVRNDLQWEWASERCPGIGQGRRFSEDEIRERLDVDKWYGRWVRIFAGLARIYADADAFARQREATCRQCAKCCRFKQFGHALFVSALEGVWMLLCSGGVPASAAQNTCPFLDGDRCTARVGRALACRTYLCDDDNDETRTHHEQLLDRLKRLTDDAGIPWRYQPVGETLAGLAETRGSWTELFWLFSA